MKIYLGSDHAGFKLKTLIIDHLRNSEMSFEVIDTGPFTYNPDDDYPDLIACVAEQVSKDPERTLGIVIGYSGQGEALVANKFPGVRAGVYYGGPENILTLLKQHNNTNVLSLGAYFLSPEQAYKAVDVWLKTLFTEEERHMRRIEKIKQIEKR